MKSTYQIHDLGKPGPNWSWDVTSSSEFKVPRLLQVSLSQSLANGDSLVTHGRSSSHFCLTTLFPSNAFQHLLKKNRLSSSAYSMVKAWIFLCVPSLATWKTGTVWKMTLWLCSLHRTEINTTCLPFFIKRTKVVRLWHHSGHQQLRWKSVMTATFTWTSLQWRMSQLQYLERTLKTRSVFVLWFHVGDATVDAGTWWLQQNAHHDPEAGCIQLHTLRRPRKANLSTQHTEAATCNSAVCTSLPISPEPAASRGAKKVQLASAWLKHLSKFTNLTEFKMQECQSAFSCLLHSCSFFICVCSILLLVLALGIPQAVRTAPPRRRVFSRPFSMHEGTKALRGRYKKEREMES